MGRKKKTPLFSLFAISHFDFIRRFLTGLSSRILPCQSAHLLFIVTSQLFALVYGCRYNTDTADKSAFNIEGGLKLEVCLVSISAAIFDIAIRHGHTW